jgi:hypothetical protein
MVRTKDDVVAAAEGAEPTKGRRGRPPSGKPSAGVKKAYVPTGKPRGRPPTGAVPKVYVPTGKPRGRPPGSGSAAKKAAQDRATVARKAIGTGTRGRPRNSDVSEPASISTTPKKRGRPSKKAAEVAPKDEDARK